jgi:hypothetical protein
LFFPPVFQESVELGQGRSSLPGGLPADAPGFPAGSAPSYHRHGTITTIEHCDAAWSASGFCSSHFPNRSGVIGTMNAIDFRILVIPGRKAQGHTPSIEFKNMQQRITDSLGSFIGILIDKDIPQIVFALPDLFDQPDFDPG